MNFFSRFRKKLINCIFIDDFDQKYQNTSTKLIIILHCCCGGFCFHHDVRASFKKFWIIFNVLNLIFINASCLFYYVKAPINNNYCAALLPLGVILGVSCKWSTYCMWAYFSNDFISKLIDYLEGKDSQSTQCMRPNQKEIYDQYCSAYPKKSYIPIIITSCCIIFLGHMVLDFEKFVNCDHFVFILYPVYVFWEKTWALEFVVRCLQIITVTPELMIYAAIPSLFLVISAEIYNRCELMSLFLRDASDSIFQRIGEIYNLEIAMDEGRVPSSLTKIDELKIKKALAQDEFVTKTIFVMKQHRQLYPIAKLYQEKLKWQSVAGNMIVFSITVICVFSIYSVIETKSFDQSLWILITIACLMPMSWLSLCFTGEMLYKMNNLIATEIYFGPWYNLEPKDRRLMFTYLTIIQRPILITIGGVYPVNLSTFPDTMNNIYSHVQILRTLQSKSKRL